MRLDATIVKHLDKDELRVLVAIEMGMRNHQIVAVSLIEKIAALRTTGIRPILASLCKQKLIGHENVAYDGYKLNYLGYDCLALHTFSSRGLLHSVGQRIGVGKEADVHICQGEQGQMYVLKLHRLGRTSFRNVKNTRDYLGNRSSASWLYMSRLAAHKEFAALKAFHAVGLPVPIPIDNNRHALLMEYIPGTLLSQVRKLSDPDDVLERLMGLIVQFAGMGVIHCDFNEFNILIDEDSKLTVIDFPQLVNIDHENAKELFERDVECVRHFFNSKFKVEVTEYPRFDEVITEELLERVAEAKTAHRKLAAEKRRQRKRTSSKTVTAPTVRNDVDDIEAADDEAENESCLVHDKIIVV